MPSTDYYPLAPGHRWTYRQKDGSTFTNAVTGVDEKGTFSMTNSVLGIEQHVRKEGTAYLTDSFEPGNFQVLLRDDLEAGDSWEIRFTANGIDSLIAMSVKERGAASRSRAAPSAICS